MVVVVVPAGDRLAREGGEEEREEDEAEALLAQERRISGASGR